MGFLLFFLFFFFLKKKARSRGSVTREVSIAMSSSTAMAKIGRNHQPQTSSEPAQVDSGSITILGRDISCLSRPCLFESW